jgi:glucose-1-phosphate adenylyltransferase
MGIYVFNARLLEKLLSEDASVAGSKHDFGRNIIPPAIDKLQVFAYPFTDVKTRAQSYWRDVGTVDAYYEANIELVHVAPELNLYDEEWPIWTYQLHAPSANSCSMKGRRGMAINSSFRGVHHFRLGGERIAPVLQRAGQRRLERAPRGGAAQRQYRRRLHDTPGHPR